MTGAAMPVAACSGSAPHEVGWGQMLACQVRSGRSSSAWPGRRWMTCMTGCGVPGGPNASRRATDRKACRWTTELRRQPGADHGGRHRRRLHLVHRPGRDLPCRPGQLRTADRQRQPAGPHYRGPAAARRVHQGAEQAARPVQRPASAGQSPIVGQGRAAQFGGRLMNKYASIVLELTQPRRPSGPAERAGDPRQAARRAFPSA